MNRRRAAARLAAVGAVGVGLSIAATGTALAWGSGTVTATVACLGTTQVKGKDVPSAQLDITNAYPEAATVTVIDETKHMPVSTPVKVSAGAPGHPAEVTALILWPGAGDKLVLTLAEDQGYKYEITTQGTPPACQSATPTPTEKASSTPTPTVAPTSTAPAVPANESTSPAAVAPAQTGKPLAATGSSNVPMLAGIAGGAVVVGAGALVATRRLRRGEH